MKKVKTYYWIAINGASCAYSPCALPMSLHVSPIPELLLGFDSLAEAQKQCAYLITASIEQVYARVAELADRANRGEIRCIKPSNPEPQTGTPTIWET